MIKSGLCLMSTIGLSIVLVLATSGCATKKYAREQVAPVSQKVATLETQTNDRFTAVVNKHDGDISQVNERISTTDLRVAQVASATQQAQGTASRAMQTADANSGKIAGNTTAITNLREGVSNALNYELVGKADVTFGFNKSTLTPEAKAALDEVATKLQTLPRSVVELAGFTDTVGSKSYNLALSRRRAEAVQRYLVMQKVPLRSIHMLGLGEEPPPESLAAEVTAVDPKASKAEINRLARRVHIQVYGAGDLQGSASRTQQ